MGQDTWLLRLLLLLMLSFPPALASDNIWTIDTAHSAIKFNFQNLKIHVVTGEFKKFFGTAHYDGHNLEDASIEVSVDPSSLDTQQPGRNQELMGKNFLYVTEYPALTFKSDKIEVGKFGEFKVQGKLKMHGVEQKVIFEAVPFRTLNFSEAGERMRLTTSAIGELQRSDFAVYGRGLDHNGLRFGDKVQVQVDLELVRS